MQVQLIQTTTADGLRLDGCLHLPSAESSAREEIRAVVCLHGAASNFYGSSTIAGVVPSMLEIGLAVLCANTRGHDSVHAATTSGGRRWQGSALEIVDECRHDVWAWADWLAAEGYSRIALLGHSLGAVKAIYAEAHQPHPSVQAVVAVSPPRLSYHWFSNGAEGAEFMATMAAAQRRIEHGEPQALMEVRLPHPMIISAATYCDKYGAGERYNFLRFLSRLQRPLLFVYGSVELSDGNPAFAHLPRDLENAAASGPPIELVTIQGADHFYRDKHHELGSCVARWLDSRSTY